MKYFINGKEIKFGDKFFHVKEGQFDGVTATTTLEGTFTKETVKPLVELGVVEVKQCGCECKKEEDPLTELDNLIANLEKIVDVIQKNIG